VTKTFTALGIGLAYDRGLILSMDEPLSTWFPELANDPSKSRLKLRHILQHTSGILTTQGSHDIYPQKDFAKFALESAIVSAPGEEFKYNNRAINIASAVVRKVTGQPMDVLIARNLFEPMEIKDYRFRHDRAGNMWAMDGLELKASDLVKIGCLLADAGKWNGRQIVSKRWMKMATQASLVSLDRDGAYGLGMFVIEMDAPLMIHVATVDALEKAGLDSAMAAKLRLAADRKFQGGKELGAALKAAMTTTELEAISAVAFREMTPIYDNLTGRKLLAHSGEIGEVVIGLQGSSIGVARTIDEKPGRAGDYTFGKIYRLVLDLTPAAP